MKTKSLASHEKNDFDLDQLPSCYDLAETKKACKKQGMKASPAIAWLGGGRVGFSLEKNFIEGRSGYQNLVGIFTSWLGETCLKPKDNLPPIRGRLVRCIVASRGDRWVVCDAPKVTAFLSSHPGAPPGKSIFFMPLEDTIFDPDKDPAIWLKDVPSDDLGRSIRLGEELLWEIAVVYSQAMERSDKFEALFEAKDPSGPVTEYVRAAQLLKDCKRAVISLIDSIAMIRACERRKKPDAETAIRQGFLIGRWLARAEAIIGNVDDIAVLKTMGLGRRKSKFWSMVNSDRRFRGKSPHEAMEMLDGHPDPDHLGKVLKLTQKGVRRGNGTTLLTKSFVAKFQKHG
ncbi:MAG: hypothetical protein JNN17_03085 [Verrucomicrobiaceae bacterium]|nr:hypothetical protein [Verrucomicrobiaceae bacterium]